MRRQEAEIFRALGLDPSEVSQPPRIAFHGADQTRGAAGVSRGKLVGRVRQAIDLLERFVDDVDNVDPLRGAFEAVADALAVADPRTVGGGGFSHMNPLTGKWVVPPLR